MLKQVKFPYLFVSQVLNCFTTVPIKWRIHCELPAIFNFWKVQF